MNATHWTLVAVLVVVVSVIGGWMYYHPGSCDTVKNAVGLGGGISDLDLAVLKNQNPLIDEKFLEAAAKDPKVMAEARQKMTKTLSDSFKTVEGEAKLMLINEAEKTLREKYEADLKKADEKAKTDLEKSNQALEAQKLLVKNQEEQIAGLQRKIEELKAELNQAKTQSDAAAAALAPPPPAAAQTPDTPPPPTAATVPVSATPATDAPKTKPVSKSGAPVTMSGKK